MSRLPQDERPFGYFVHHQGQGHAERCAALLNALPASRRAVVFCARDDIFPPLPANIDMCCIPSLFECSETVPPVLAEQNTPETLHCAPLGWSNIRRAVAAITEWFRDEDPALFIVDVSAELGQLARIASVPHVKVLQHGDRLDPGHMAAYTGSVGLLAPFSSALAQHQWPPAMLGKIHFAPGLGLRPAACMGRKAARAAIGLKDKTGMVLVISGGGGAGMPSAPIAIGARSTPDMRWITAGAMAKDWHATEPGNLEHRGWVEDVEIYLAAADIVVSSAGNTVCHQVLRIGRPWIVIPEWRYFDEQQAKAEALERAGVATVRRSWPASAQAWREAMREAFDIDTAYQQALVDPDAARTAGHWLENLSKTLWTIGAEAGPPVRQLLPPQTEIQEVR